MPQTAAFSSNFRRRVLLIFVFLVSTTVGDLISRCQSRCEEDLSASNEIDRDFACGAVCKIDKCKYGCTLYQNATLDSSSCRTACNETEDLDSVSKIQNCNHGCNYANDLFVQQVIANSGDPSEPLLVADSLTNTSLQLEWTAATNPDILYLIQWKYYDLVSDWTYYQPNQPLNDTTVEITNLHPYTTYLFKVIWIITAKDTLQSPPSLPMTTLPSGVPSSSPTITELSSPSHSTIYITWEAPLFINGPLTNYQISLIEILAEDHTQIIKDVLETTFAYTFTLLKAETLYEVKVSAGNVAGHGPPAVENITTVAAPDVPEDQAEFLFTDKNTVQTVPYQDVSDFPMVDMLYTYPDDSHLQGLAVHYWKNLLVFSVSDGALCTRLADEEDGMNDTTSIIYIGDNITAVSVDWLYDEIYFVEDDTIVRCGLTGDDVEIVVTNLDPVPADIVVDPYSGYLYWTQVGAGHGVYRIDLAHIDEDVNTTAELIIEQPYLATLTIDFTAFQLLYVNDLNETFMSAFIDGTSKIAIHENVINDAKLKTVSGLVQYGDIFTWSSDKSVLYYEANADGGYYHNELFLFSITPPYVFNAMDIKHSSLQPYPVPISPVSKLQALFTDVTAIVTWEKPPKLDFTGKGAWREWLYEIEVQDLVMDNITILDGISTTNYQLTDLEPETPYSVRVRAYSLGGYGQWSRIAFQGETLQSADPSPNILFVSDSNILQVAIDGTQEDVLLAVDVEITDLDWYDNYVYWSTEEGAVQILNRNDASGDVTTVDEISSVEVLVVDWFTGMLYWLAKTDKTIWRSFLAENGTESGREAIVTSPATDMALDSVQAYLYWTTSRTVECARLNGENDFIYQELEKFSGEEITALTLNFDDSLLYWFIHTASGLKLFQAELAHNSVDPITTVEEISFINSYTMKPALHYYSHRLFWLNENHQVVITTLGSDNNAILMTSELGVTLNIVQPSLHPLPAGYDDVPLVIPSSIDAASIEVVGVWDNFQIRWSPSEITYDTVWYQYELTYGNTQVVETLTVPYHNITGLSPYTEMTIKVEAYTYWATSASTTVVKMSPMSVPSVPQNARGFTKHDKDIYTNEVIISGDVRWEKPNIINGLLLGYHIYIGMDINGTVSWQNETLYVSDSTRYMINNMVSDSLYYIQIDAFTAIGSGEATETITIDTQVENPSPKLLVISSDGVDSEDLDNGDSDTLIDSSNPLFVSYISHESLLFWIDGNLMEILKKEEGSQNNIEVTSISNTPSGLTADWIGRNLYWTENSDNKGSIYLYDLNNDVNLKIITTPNKVGNIVVDTYESHLYFTEESENKTELMVSGLKGENKQPLFTPDYRRRRDVSGDCNCQSNISVSHVIAIDQSDADNTVLYFADADEGHLWRSDTAACQCQLLVDANSVARAGLPPDSLAVDQKSVYWTNTNQGVLNSCDKVTGDDFQSQNVIEVNSIATYGTHLQPMPDTECLAPGNYAGPIANLASTSDSITLDLTSPTWPPQCSGISKALVTYTVHYGLMNLNGSVVTCDEGLQCDNVTSTNKEVTITELQPYTWYVFQASYRNFYTQNIPTLSDATNYRTEPGVPSPVEDLMAIVKTAYIVNITWIPPLEPHGPLDEITYKVLFTNNRLPPGTWTEITGYEISKSNTEEVFFLLVKELEAATVYSFKVHAYPAVGDEFSESVVIQNTTFEEPGLVRLIAKTDTTFDLSWISPADNSVKYHIFKYSEPDGDKRNTDPHTDTESNTTYSVKLKQLTPLTSYNVWVDVIYNSHNNYERPDDYKHQQFTTLAGVPGIPLKPYFEELGVDIWQVAWNEPLDNGAVITQYNLQYSRVQPEFNWTSDGNWTTVYNKTEPYWVMVDLDEGESYIFRVECINEIGSSGFSNHSSIFIVALEPIPVELDLGLYIIIAIGCGVGLLLIVMILVICLAIKRRRRKLPKLPGDVRVHYDADQELATLRAYPNAVIRQSNAFYAVGNLPELDVELPLFPRERLKLVTFLGSGAFGEVFEGLALDITGDNSGETKVAVKTLRKGATDQEKEEFLKEAQLMSNFKHPHILRLLGVCLDNDPQFIILELMEAGDLLSYLRSCRPTAASPAALGCMDLIEISIDVCRGCRYLEEMHFVHRDLAARNCLVSSRDPRFRNVKIGDFGLARDIYKNDYYRKEGEGLLPVRWMSPESLVDGVFTIQSDLWSFGVLLWEIMTLGQQPYPARTNLEVLHFVTTGGRLSRPDNCPDDVHQLMLKCWHEDPEGRPTFKFLLQKLETFKRKSLTMDGLDNLAFDAPINYSKIQQPQQTTLEDEEGYLEPVNSKQSLKSRGSYRTDLLGSDDSSGIGSGASLKPPNSSASPILGKKFPTSSSHNTPKGSPRIDGRRSPKFPALSHPSFERERDRTSHNARYAMDVSVTPRSTPRSTPTSARKLYHDNKAFQGDEDDVIDKPKDDVKSSLSKATGKGLLGRQDSGTKPRSLSKATGANLFGNKGVSRQSSSVSQGMPSEQNSQPNSFSKATGASVMDANQNKGSVSKGTGANGRPAPGKAEKANQSNSRYPNPFRKDPAEPENMTKPGDGSRPYENVQRTGSTKSQNPEYENVDAKKRNSTKVGTRL
ncbi:proto-oncogene tyrosine-protein kinase ROS-like [Glandiceps talaboti]